MVPVIDENGDEYMLHTYEEWLDLDVHIAHGGEVYSTEKGMDIVARLKKDAMWSGVGYGVAAAVVVAVILKLI